MPNAVRDMATTDVRRNVACSRLAAALGREAHRALREPASLPADLHNALVLDVGPQDATDLLERARPALAGRMWLRLDGRPPTEGRARLVRVLSHPAQVNGVAFANGGSTIATACSDYAVRSWDARSGALTMAIRGDVDRVAGHDAPVVSVAWSPDDRRIATVDSAGALRLWDPLGAPCGAALEAGGPFSVRWSPDGGRLATVGADGLHLWNADLTAIGVVPAAEIGGRGFAVAWSPDGARLAFAGEDAAIRIVTVDAGTGILAEGHTGWVQSLAWSPDGARLASGGRDGTVRIWSPDTARPVGTLEADRKGVVLAVAWSPDGGRLASGGWDRSMRVWDPADGRLAAELQGHTNWITSIDWSADGSLLASGDGDGDVRIWNALGADSGPAEQGHAADVRDVAWSPDGSLLASGAGDHEEAEGEGDNSAAIWDPGTGRRSHTLEGHVDDVVAVAWSPDGRALATGSLDRSVRIWDVGSGHGVMQLVNTGGWHARWSPDGAFVAATAGDERVLVKDGHWGTLGALEGHGSPVSALAWAPDSRHLASAEEAGPVRIWDVVERALVRELEGPTKPTLALVWSADGHHLAAGGGRRSQDVVSGHVFVRRSDTPAVPLAAASGVLEDLKDCVVRVWDLRSASRGPMVELHGSDDPILALAWYPESGLLASAGMDSQVRIWDPSTGAPVARAATLSWGAALLALGEDRLLVADDGAATGDRPIPYTFRIVRERA